MPIFVGVRGLNYFSCSVIISPLISIAPLFPMSLLHTGAAPVTKLLLIAGRTDTPLTGIPVISRRAGKRKGIFCSFRTHKITLLFIIKISTESRKSPAELQKTISSESLPAREQTYLLHRIFPKQI